MDLRGGIVSHDEVVTMGLLDLVDGDGLREGGNAPVRDTADNAPIAQDEGADGLNDLLDFGE